MGTTTLSMSQLFAVRLKTAISANGISNAKLCQEVQMSRSALTGYLHGEFLPKKDRLRKISDVLDVSYEWLIGFDVPMKKGVFTGTETLSKGLAPNAEMLEKSQYNIKFVPVISLDQLEGKNITSLFENETKFNEFIPYCLGENDDISGIIGVRLDSANTLLNTCMMPYLMPGDIVFADINATAQNDDIILVDNLIDPGVFCIYSGDSKPFFTFPEETPMVEFMHSKSKILAVVKGVIRRTTKIACQTSWSTPLISDTLAVARDADGNGDLNAAPDVKAIDGLRKIDGSEGY